MAKYPMTTGKNQLLADALGRAETTGDHRELQNEFNARNDVGDWQTDEDRKLCSWVEMALRYPHHGLQVA